MTIKNIVITDRIVDPTIEKEVFGSNYLIHCLDGVINETNLEIMKKADGLLVWHSQILFETIQSMEFCKGIVRYGTGYDNIDLVAAKQFGIPVCNTPDYGIEEVADTTSALILNAIRQIKHYEENFKSGNFTWGSYSDLVLPRTSSHKLGIIGCGRIGSAVALRMKALGIAVGFYDPYVARGYEKSISANRYDSLDDLISNSTIISIHAPLTPETYGMVNRDFIEKMNDNTILVNTARGQIVANLNIILEGLQKNKIQFMAMDVAPEEYKELSGDFYSAWKNSSLASRILITPHSAYYSERAFPEMRFKASQNLKRIIEGFEPLNLVNN